MFEGSGVPVQPNVILVQTPTFLGKSLTGLKTLGEDNKTKDIEFTLTLKINDTTEFDNKAIKTTFRDGKSAFITTDEIAGKDVILTIEATLTDIVITDTTRASEDMLDGFTFKLVKTGKFPTNTGKGENGFSSNLDNKLFEISENDLDIVQPVTIVNKSGISSVKLLRKAPIALTNNNTYQAFGVADNNQLIGIKGTKDTSSESFTKFTSEEMNFENPVTNSNIDKITTINSNVANGSNAFAGFTVNKEDTTTEGEVYGGLAKLVEDNGTYKWVRQSQDINRGFDPTAKIYYMIFADDANDNKDYFVGVSDQGQIVYSLVDNSTDEDKENSLEWNKADISKINGFENHNVKAIAYGEINNEKMFVAMGKGGIPVYAKGDPSIWSSGNYVDSKNPFKDTDDVDRMIYTNLNGSPLFVAVGGNQHTAISKDGKTWQGLTIDQGSSSSNTDHIYSITALGDKAVILSLKDYIYYLSKTNDSTYQWIKAKKQDGTFSWKTKSTESDRAFDLYAVKNPKNDETSTSSYEYKVLCAGNSGEIVSFIATVGNDGTVTCAGAEREYPSTNSVDLGNEYSLWAFAEGKNSIIAVGGGIRESKRSGTSTDKDIQEKKGGFIIKTSKTSNNNWDDIGNSWEVIYENITGNSKYNIGIFDNYYAIKAAAYGNGMYVVAGFEGNIAYSKDEGVSWEPFAASSTSKTIPDNVTRIANNWKTGSEEVFVAVGSSKIGGSTIPTLSMIKNPSNSESKWEDIPITDKMKSIVDENGSRVWEKFLNIIYFPGNTGLAAENENRYTGFFAFGDMGTILKSEDGTEWEIEKGPDYHTINGERIFATNGSSIMILPGNKVEQQNSPTFTKVDSTLMEAEDGGHSPISLPTISI